MNHKILPLFILLLQLGCKQTHSSASTDWIILFDGSSTEGWRAYNGKYLPEGWGIKDNTLTFISEKKTENEYNIKENKDLIYGAEEFDNFELYLEWKIPPGGNSGIFYHIKEGYETISEISPEYQIIDDENYIQYDDLTEYNLSLGYTENPNELKPLQQTAADYAMHVADTIHKILYPTGKWNSSKIVFTPEKAEHWLNGKKVLEFEPWSEDWYAKKKSGKWKLSPDYGEFKTGHIGLQDHSSTIAFRNIKIKKL